MLVSSKIISYVTILLLFCEMYLQSIVNIICYIIICYHYIYPYIKYNMYCKVMFLHAPPPGDVVTWLSGRLASLFSQPSLLIAFQICYIFKYYTFQILEFSNDFSFLRLSFYIKGDSSSGI